MTAKIFDSSHHRLTLFIITWLFSQSLHAHFALAPKIEISPSGFEAPQANLIQIQSVDINRQKYADYLNRVTAFDTKYDRVQTNFFSHFEVIRGIALFHPDNVHKFIDNIAALKQQPRFYQLAVTNWFKEQALMFARFNLFINQARQQKLEHQPEIKAVLNFYQAGAKTEFLEELIVLGKMPPSLEGLKQFVTTIPENNRHSIDTGIVDDQELTPVAEQERMKKRWLDFRQQILQQANVEQQCANIPASDADPQTVIITFQQHKISLQDYLAIFGKPPLASQWKPVSRVNCTRLGLFHAMADTVDQLGIVPDKVTQKINTSTDLYLASNMMISQLGPLLVSEADRKHHQSMLRQLMAYPDVLRLKDALVKSSQPLLADERFKLDQNFFNSVSWGLQRTMAPKHSIHF